jgi:2-keto-4-pentenoate hydratase/2-oxohepta-3-ene-1,7-dioic acid hydratase in catechol pathway
MKIICIGRNYADHARELNNPLPEKPVFFLKPDSSVLKNNKPFFYPPFTRDLHYEAEILARICKVGKSIPESFAMSYIGEIGMGIDFTARDLQEECKKKGLPWEMAKAFDNAAAISRFIPFENFKNVQDIFFRLDLNGATVQKSTTADMIFSFARIISYVSQFMTLKTGDIIFSGTPSGVGPVKIGDRLQGYLGEEKMLDFYIR